jgi:hypothetical protein
MYDVRKEQYTTVIREMIRHENDVTNHRLMWLLIFQGFLVGAYSKADQAGTLAVLAISLVGILVSLLAFGVLYMSYHARGYLHFLGKKAKRGELQEEYLPLDGWPKERIKGWWRAVWVCPWLAQGMDVLQPWLFLPGLLIFMWLCILLNRGIMLNVWIDLGLAAILVAVILPVFCIVWVWLQGKGEKERTEDPSIVSNTKGETR